ncbi:MAG: DUF402 domain-containing protein [Ilumatobacteraceae bacterium]
MVDDTDELLALFVPPGAPLAYADVVWPTDTGRHPWWPGRHWRSGGTLMVQRPGEAYSVWHQWASLDRSFLGWYVNLQEPLRPRRSVSTPRTTSSTSWSRPMARGR